MIARLVLVLLTAAAWSSSCLAIEDGQIFKDWRAKCVSSDTAASSNERSCHIFQDLLQKESGKRVLHVAIGYLPKQQPLTIIITLPLGISLPPGIRLRIDEKQQKDLVIQACFANGCQAAFQPDQAWLKGLMAGSKAEVIFNNIHNQAIGVPVSLQGITAGIKALGAARR